MSKREYGAGSIYQRHTPACPKPDKDGRRPKHKCTGRWVGVIADSEDAGYTASGARKRITVTAKTEAELRRRFRDRQLAFQRGQETSQRLTVKAWAEEYLEIRLRELRPKAYNAAANPIQKWVIPTIGQRRLDQLTTRDLRAVQNVQRAVGRQPADTHRVLRTMLKRAVAEGHHVPAVVLEMKPPTSEKSDRRAMTVDEGLRMLQAAADRPDGSRWLFTLLYGARQGECLGLTWDAVDLEAEPFGEAILEWQLQTLPYVDPADKAAGFRVPDGHESIHLDRGYHLVRPKSQAGYRVAPFLPPVRDAMRRWREIAPESPHRLVWPRPNGAPRNDKADRAEWWALQEAAGVHHPTRRRKVDGKMVPAPYHVHECRNFAATMLLEGGIDDTYTTALLGHSTITTSRRYMSVRREPLVDAMRKVGERLQLG